MVYRIRQATSRFMLEVPGIEPDLFAERLLRRGVKLPQPKYGF